MLFSQSATPLRAEGAGMSPQLRAHNPYAVLGVAVGADQPTCRKAWLRLALKYHPDKSSSPHARDAFDAISRAYRAISDGANLNPGS
mmetsp:Transcript_23321/g.92480  ORF Transcript_23321/g.92480 Transcript_23321/m.92480 type:complete len:87 (-) Transcript_23321:102-362(-)